MSDRPARSARHPQSKRGGARSGEHPAVQAYRAKLDSISEGASAAMNKLDQTLEDFLSDLRTPVPPKP